VEETKRFFFYSAPTSMPTCRLAYSILSNIMANIMAIDEGAV